MEKRNSNLVKSHPCIFRFGTALLSVAFVLIVFLGLVPSADALMINYDTGMVSSTFLTGTFKVDYRVPVDYDFLSSSFVSCSYPIGGIMPFSSVAHDENDAEEDYQYLIEDLDGMGVRMLTNYSRRQTSYTNNLGTYVADRLRFNYTPSFVGNYYSRAPYAQITFKFDPYYFQNYAPSVLKNMVFFNLDAPVLIRTSMTVSVVIDGALVTETFTHDIDSSTGGTFYPLDGLDAELALILAGAETQQCFISDFTIVIVPTDANQPLSLLMVDMLAGAYDPGDLDSYKNYGSPYMPVAGMSNIGPTAYNWMKHLENTLVSGGSVSPTPPTSSNVWSTWLASTVSGFFDFELMPNFSLGGIFSAIISVAIAIVLLKFFAGG